MLVPNQPRTQRSDSASAWVSVHGEMGCNRLRITLSRNRHRLDRSRAFGARHGLHQRLAHPRHPARDTGCARREKYVAPPTGYGQRTSGMRTSGMRTGARGCAKPVGSRTRPPAATVESSGPPAPRPRVCPSSDRDSDQPTGIRFAEVDRCRCPTLSPARVSRRGRRGRNRSVTRGDSARASSCARPRTPRRPASP